MIVCQCTGVTDRTLRDLIRAGATTAREIVRRCGAGGECTACRSEIAAMIARTAARPACASSGEREGALV